MHESRTNSRDDTACATRTLSPLNRSLLRRVNVLAGAAPEQKRRHVVRQEGTRLRIHHIQAVVIDQHGLLLDPITPALLTDLLNDTAPDLPGKRSTVEAAASLTAAHTFHVRHDNTKSMCTRCE